jgi:hypothetical protein
MTLLVDPDEGAFPDVVDPPVVDAPVIEVVVDPPVVEVVVVHEGTVTVFACRVTSPLSANSRPSTDAPVSAVMLVSARTVPTNDE